MPTYATSCSECSEKLAVKLTFSQYDDVHKGGKYLECPSCSGTLKIQLGGPVEFILRDGISGGWMSKSIKERKLRAARREMVGRKERDHVFKPKLVPNVGGELTGTWKEAQGYASSKGLDTKSYQAAVAKEARGG